MEVLGFQERIILFVVYNVKKKFSLKIVIPYNLLLS